MILTQDFFLFFLCQYLVIILIESILVRANANWAAVSLISFLILFVYVTFKYSKKLIFINNITNFIFGLCFLFSYRNKLRPMDLLKKFLVLIRLADFLISQHNLEHINKLVVGDRMLFSNLRYIFFNNEIQMYVPFAPNKKWATSFSNYKSAACRF